MKLHTELGYLAIIVSLRVMQLHMDYLPVYLHKIKTLKYLNPVSHGAEIFNFYEIY